MESHSNTVSYVVHSSTIYLCFYLIIKIIVFLSSYIVENKFFKLGLNKIYNNVKKIYYRYMNNSEYCKINDNIEIIEKKIKKYNKIIEQNKKENQHLSEYDLLILNGKYTRKLMKEQNELNQLIKIKETQQEESKNNIFFKIFYNFLIFLTSTNKFIKLLRIQIVILLLFLIVKYNFQNKWKDSCLQIHSQLIFKKNFQFISSDICNNNLFTFLCGYNMTHFFFMTMKYNCEIIYSILLKEEKKKKA
ncbi:conserved Plasmodium protein, unknown function [Plasmodium sp. gorilla clade G2]|uniref:conserved Plasmodium protein, unknown function n=1 Tax=Plasmodium sp. gorilla clade G2 TaxID=880535 RepID=UPI000D2AF262|nr:conserved Plasmodium protein, unknown function [Plasmodium sp. gorilla clade G2]SOV20130.1 conserved Plasmodium protein, unknown function [Plasmodium sp. gorilla clade G2]